MTWRGRAATKGAPSGRRWWMRRGQRSGEWMPEESERGIVPTGLRSPDIHSPETEAAVFFVHLARSAAQSAAGGRDEVVCSPGFASVFHVRSIRRNSSGVQVPESARNSGGFTRLSQTAQTDAGCRPREHYELLSSRARARERWRWRDLAARDNGGKPETPDASHPATIAGR